MVRQSFNNTNGKIIYKHKLSRFFINTNGRAIRQNDQETQMVHVKAIIEKNLKAVQQLQNKINGYLRFGKLLTQHEHTTINNG